MRGSDWYRSAEALAAIARERSGGSRRDLRVAEVSAAVAQVEATLALAAATAMGHVDRYRGPDSDEVDAWAEVTGHAPGADAADVEDARQVLGAAGHRVTGSLGDDVSRAIDVEQQRREDDRRDVAVALGHSPEYADVMRHSDLVASARSAARAADDTLAAFGLPNLRTMTRADERCSSCPWPADTECGGALGVCPGTARTPRGDGEVDR